MVVALVACSAFALAQAPAGPYVGPATCNSSCCHGSTKPLAGRIDQDEYVSWFTRDPHRLAWSSLSGALGRKMGERLGLRDVAHAPECLSCHATGASSSSSLAEFGVSCEACHGAASGWYGSHFQKGFDVADAVARQGFVDLKDPARLAERCLACHLGDAADDQKIVDHRLIAAGHPDLRFETGRYLLRMSPHWRQRGVESLAWQQRSALVGQAVALREQARKVACDAAAAPSKSWPEFADFDCASCHHAQPGSAWQSLREWRLARRLPAPIGRPLFDDSRVATTNAVVAAVDPNLAEQLGAAFTELESLASDPLASSDRVRSAAESASALADRAVKQLASSSGAKESKDTSAAVAAVVQALADRAELLAARDDHGARQAAWLLQSLRAEFEVDRWQLRRDGVAASVEHELVAPLDHASDFDPLDFSKRFAELARRGMEK